MSTLKKPDFETLNQQIEDAKGQLISKEEVLHIFHDKLKEIDIKNRWIVDQFDGEFVKEMCNAIIRIKPNNNK